MQASARRRTKLAFELAPDIFAAFVHRILGPWHRLWRRGPIYRQLLKGPMPDRIRHHPFDPLPRHLEEADSLLKGRFRFAGEAIEIASGSIFDRSPTSVAWAAALHSFEWLPSLSAAGGDAARELAAQLISEWLARFAHYSEPAWSPAVTARRLVQLFAHGRFVIANSDLLWRSRLLVSLARQSALLARTAGETPAGLPRLETAVACVLCSNTLRDDAAGRQIALHRLEREIAIQILPDGGHVSRSPETLLLAFRQIVMAADSLSAAGHPIPDWLRNAQDRMAPMLRFFRHGDGGLALFNGGGEGDARMIAALLARDEVRGQAFQQAPHSGFQRLAVGRSIAIMDCGAPPPGRFSTRAHAGALAFEFGAGSHRIVVNCGAEKEYETRWQGALRATAAHSTATIADTSMLGLLPPGMARNLLGARLVAEEMPPQSARRETPNGWSVEAHHDYYLPDFGVVHERMLCLAPRGASLTGCDRLLPDGRRAPGALPFAIRFHIHPDVRISRAQSGDVLLKLPGGDGWRFRHGGSLAIEDSVYAGQGGVRRTEQLVLSGTVNTEPVEIGWIFEQIGGG